MSISHKISKEDYDHIPFFDGNPSELAFFCDIVESAYAIVCAENVTERDTNHHVLFIKIKSRLTGPARNVLLSNNVVHLLELIRLLKENFADSRSFETLKNEIFQTTINPRESPIEFVNRIQEIRNLVFIRLKLDGLSADILKEFMTRIDKEIIFHILKCLPPTLSNHIMIFNPNNLEEVRSIIYNKCSFILANLNSSFTKKSNHHTFKKHTQQNYRPFKTNYVPNYHYNYNPPPNYQYNFPSNTQNIPHNTQRAIEQKPVPSFQQRQPSNRVFQNPNSVNHPFNRHRPIMPSFSQNTDVTMRTWNRPNTKNWFGPHELTYIQNQNEEPVENKQSEQQLQQQQQNEKIKQLEEQLHQLKLEQESFL